MSSPGRVGGGSLPRRMGRARAKWTDFGAARGTLRPGRRAGGRVKVAESISPAVIGSAGARKTPLINTSSRPLDNLRPRAADTDPDRPVRVRLPPAVRRLLLYVRCTFRRADYYNIRQASNMVQWCPNCFFFLSVMEGKVENFDIAPIYRYHRAVCIYLTRFFSLVPVVGLII